MVKKAHYIVVSQLEKDDPKLLSKTLYNMRNTLEDPRLKGKLEMELVAFSGGTTVFLKDNPYEADLLVLKEKGVIMAQCLNSMKGLNPQQRPVVFVRFVRAYRQRRADYLSGPGLGTACWCVILVLT